MTTEDALAYITGGRGKGTLIGKSHRYTYEFSQPKNQKGLRIFVRVLSGPSNVEDYTYIGFLKLVGVEEPGRIKPRWVMFAGQKGKPKAPSFKALKWYMQAIQDHQEAAGQAEFEHEGICGVCGRTLTTPESIRSGIGPVCAGRGR